LCFSPLQRYQRSKKGIATRFDDKAVYPKGKEIIVEIVKTLVKERLYMPPDKENPVGEDEMDS